MSNESSCVRHPATDQLVIIRRWQMEFCDGDRVAAVLLSYFEHWHNYKIIEVEKNRQSNIVSENHGYGGGLPENLWQFHSEDELELEIMIFKREAIALAIKLLEKKGVLKTGRNPNPKYKFDNTRFFLFIPEVANQWLDNYKPKDKRKELESRKEERKKKRKPDSPSPENR